MATFDNLSDIYSALSVNSLDSLLFRLFLAIGIVLLGIGMGRLAGYTLRKFSSKIEIKSINPSFLDLLIVVIQWSIYIAFIDFALIQLRISGLTDIVAKILVVIPALIGSLILISVGFVVGSYLKKVLKEIKIPEGELLSRYLFYFIIYIFGVYALKVALISLDSFVSNWIVVIASGVFIAGLGYIIVRSHPPANHH